MPLNKEIGEYLEGLGHMWRVAPLSKWQETPFFEDAAQHACNVFIQAGAPQPVRLFEEHILIQEYPLLDKLVYLFQFTVKGAEMYADYTYTFNPAAIEHLTRMGKWQPVSGPILPQ